MMMMIFNLDQQHLSRRQNINSVLASTSKLPVIKIIMFFCVVFILHIRESRTVSYGQPLYGHSATRTICTASVAQRAEYSSKCRHFLTEQAPAARRSTWVAYPRKARGQKG